jgi:indole-3-glycerol phosphate synthase
VAHVADVLAEILAHKRAEVEAARAQRPLAQLKGLPGYFLPRRNFYGAVTVPRGNRPNIIAELKARSPSAGLLRGDYDPGALARQYESGGAAALSVLTDKHYFGGDVAHLELVKAQVGLPLLRKDFLLDPYQVYESRASGADAVLIIGEALPPATVAELVGLARELELAVLLEVHSRATLVAVLGVLPGPAREGVLLGINNRDLHRQVVDLEIAEQLVGLVPPGLPIVVESGIRTRADVERMHTAGARALLIGEALVRSLNPGQTLRELAG